MKVDEPLRILTFGPFSLDAGARQLFRHGEPIPLTPKAFDTLLVLVTRYGRVVSKEELLRLVWPDTFVEEATLVQNVLTLRRALSDLADDPQFIVTVPRRGYRFAARVTERRVPRDNQGRWPMRRAAGPAFVSIAALGAIVLLVRGALPDRARTLRFEVSQPPGLTFSTSGSFMAMSPDGRALAFVAASSERHDQLWVRALDSLLVQPLAGTEGAAQPFWSPDSHAIAFFADTKLKKVAIGGGAVQTICDAPTTGAPLTGTWNRDGVILFSSVGGGLLRVSAIGGRALPMTLPGHTTDTVLWPQFFPDGRHLLFLDRNRDPERRGIYVGTLDSPLTTHISSVDSSAASVPSGHVLFVRDGTLVAQKFDPSNTRLTGDPVPIADEVAYNVGTGRATFSVSTTGALAYRTVANTILTWFDREGKELGSIGSPGTHHSFSISPDGDRVAVARVDPRIGTTDLWVTDAHGSRRLTFDPGWELNPRWSPDGAHIAYASNGNGRWALKERASSGTGSERTLLTSATVLEPSDWESTGALLYTAWDANTKRDFWLLSPSAAGKPVPLRRSAGNKQAGRLSPDGRWLAYVEQSSGPKVYVHALRGADSTWQIAERGAEPRWRTDGRELLYLAPDLTLMSVAVRPGAIFDADPPRPLFRTRAVATSGSTGQAYDVTADGQRFLIKTAAAPPVIRVVIDWPDELTH